MQSLTSRPLALVYRGPAGCSGCSEAVAGLLERSGWGFAVRYAGPGERLQVSTATLRSAALYAQPGGDGTIETAFAAMKDSARAIRRYVRSGGRYLGICMGAYLAGHTPGFRLLPGDSGQYITVPGASVATEADTVVQLRWRNMRRYMYFQDGAYFLLEPRAAGVVVLATYAGDEIAAMVAPFGQGKVAVSGPHPEATVDWYRAYDLVDPDGIDADLGHDLIDTLMQPSPAGQGADLAE